MFQPGGTTMSCSETRQEVPRTRARRNLSTYCATASHPCSVGVDDMFQDLLRSDFHKRFMASARITARIEQVEREN